MSHSSYAQVTLAQHKGSYSYEYTSSSLAYQLAFEAPSSPRDYFYKLVG